MCPEHDFPIPPAELVAAMVDDSNLDEDEVAVDNEHPTDDDLSNEEDVVEDEDTEDEDVEEDTEDEDIDFESVPHEPVYVFTEHEYEFMEKCLNFIHSIDNTSDIDDAAAAFFADILGRKVFYGKDAGITEDDLADVQAALDGFGGARSRSLKLYICQCWEDCISDIYTAHSTIDSEGKKTMMQIIVDYFEQREADENPEIDPEIAAEVEQMMKDIEDEDDELEDDESDDEDIEEVDESDDDEVDEEADDEDTEEVSTEETNIAEEVSSEPNHHVTIIGPAN